MRLYLWGQADRYEMENILRMFFFEASVEEGMRPRGSKEGDFCYLRAVRAGGRTHLLAAVFAGGARKIRAVRCEEGGDGRLMLAGVFFSLLSELTGRRPEWGIMTGVRPAKFVQKLLERGFADAEDRLVHTYLVGREKAGLAVETATAGIEIAKRSKKNSYSLYISIPFCPSRCEYCSFVSKSVGREGALLDPYIRRLSEEMAVTAAAAERLGLSLAAVYIGGGTPTVLSLEQLERLLLAVEGNFPTETAMEYTVEAGRPDTITLDKLRLLQHHGVTRVSINPQTFQDRVLKGVGRNHTSADTVRAFSEARAVGIRQVNADLIAGLRKDSFDGFCESVERLLALGPEEVTVHALTVKRASFLREQPYFSGDAAAMIRHSLKRLKESGYRPYYMYKQKGTVDSLENVGYAKPGFEGLYNVFMMDEVHTVLACGAGAVTKLVNQDTGRIGRVFNYKYPSEYIDGFSVLLQRKEGIGAFYESGL